METAVFGHKTDLLSFAGSDGPHGLSNLGHMLHLGLLEIGNMPRGQLLVVWLKKVRQFSVT